MRIPSVALALSAILCSPALGQSFNVDVNATFGTPGTGYGGAAGKPGFWNVAASAGPWLLAGLDLAPSQVRLQASSYSPFAFDNPGTPPGSPEHSLLDDISTGNQTWTFTNLLDGTYDVYTYAWTPDDPFSISAVSVNGSPAKTVGGNWTGSLKSGFTHCMHTVTVSDGVIVVAVTAALGSASVNGLQIVRQPQAPTYCFNVDLGDAFGPPSTQYGGGAGQEGLWNLVTSTGPVTLKDTAAAASVNLSGDSYNPFAFDNPGTGGNDQALLDDLCDGVRTWTFVGLPPGVYDVYTYAWAPDNALSITTVTVNDGAAQTVGGAWTGAPKQGVTHALHQVVVLDGRIVVRMSTAVGFTSTNGFQIVRTTAPATSRINVDVELGTDPPWASYSAAAGQAGVWNSIGGAGPSALVDYAGTPTPVTLQVDSFTGSSSILHPPGGDAMLMEDGCVGGTTWSFSGLPDGPVRVYTYAMHPVLPGVVTDVSVNGGAVQRIGGVWAGLLQPGITHSTHFAWVQNGQLVVSTTSATGPSFVNGFQIVPLGDCPTPASYCTAKVNSLGCHPRISSSGVPSAGDASPFHVTASDVVSTTLGLLIYSTAGPGAKPFQGGTLCISSPIVRTAGQGSGGSQAPKDCSGTFSFEFNDHITSGKDPALVLGAQVWAQYWYRDQGSPSGTGLTDGLWFMICE